MEVKQKKAIEKSRISKQEAKAIAKKIPVKRKIDIDQLRRGLEIEQEHGKKLGKNTNVTKGSLVNTGKIALAHIKEIPDYYTRLDKMEKMAEKHKDPHDEKHKENEREWKKDDKKRVKRFKKETKRDDVDEAWVDPIEVLHDANRRRILQGAKEGKFWLVRSENIEEAQKRKPLKYRYSKVYGDATSASSGGGMREEERDYIIQKILETTTTGAIGGFPKPMGGGDFSQGDPAFGGRNRFTKEQLAFALARLLGQDKKFVRHPVA